MAGFKTTYICQQCGYEAGKWFGKCPECNAWGSLVEEVVERSSRSGKSGSGKGSSGSSKEPVAMSNVSIENKKRISTKISELDRVLGGGVVPGQVILIAGEPGIGKSTLLIQLSDNMGKGGIAKKVLYVSGEESVHQITLRARRLGIKGDGIQILEETDIDAIVEKVSSVSRVSKGSGSIDTHATFDTIGTLIIDSIQTMQTSDLSGMAGAAGQVRECTYRLVRLAKQNNLPIFIVGHVTKQGSVAGPALLMHLVDTVLWFEGGKDLSFRLLRARKNRFGATDEVGIFSMEDKGLVSVDDTSKLFLSEHIENIAGSCISSIIEGTRPIIVEVQSLLVPTKLAFAKRVAQGIDSKRLELLLAVLQRRVGLKVSDFDCFVNIVGGIKINDTALDMAICLSIASSYFDKPLPKKLLAVGEVGLMGEVRSVMSQEKRLKEASRLGFKTKATSEEYSYVREAVGKFFK